MREIRLADALEVRFGAFKGLQLPPARHLHALAQLKDRPLDGGLGDTQLRSNLGANAVILDGLGQLEVARLDSAALLGGELKRRLRRARLLGRLGAPLQLGLRGGGLWLL